MAWVKKVFDHDIITSEFLNDLQDYIIHLENTRTTQFVPYQEGQDRIPQTRGATAVVSAANVMLGQPDDQDAVYYPIVGDTFVGVPSGYIAYVSAVSGNNVTLYGTGERLS